MDNSTCLVHLQPMFEWNRHPLHSQTLSRSFIPIQLKALAVPKTLKHATFEIYLSFGQLQSTETTSIFPQPKPLLIWNTFEVMGVKICSFIKTIHCQVIIKHLRSKLCALPLALVLTASLAVTQLSRDRKCCFPSDLQSAMQLYLSSCSNFASTEGQLRINLST